MRELYRKIAHVLIGTGCLLGGYYILQLYGPDALELILVSILGLLVLCDVLIADYGWKLPFYHQLQRKHEVEGLHTATLGLLSSIIAYKFFALPVAIAAIAMLIYGDSAAAMVGLCTDRTRKKTAFARAATMLLVSVAIGWFVFGWIGVVMGLVAMLSECLVTKIDDAITIPLFSGLAGEILIRFFL